MFVVPIFFLIPCPFFQTIKSNSPDEVAQSLMHMLSNENAPPHIKVLSAVLLRGLVTGYKSEWGNMSEVARSFVRDSLVAFMTKGRKRKKRKYISNPQLIIPSPQILIYKHLSISISFA